MLVIRNSWPRTITRDQISRWGLGRWGERVRKLLESQAQATLHRTQWNTGAFSDFLMRHALEVSQFNGNSLVLGEIRRRFPDLCTIQFVGHRIPGIIDHAAVVGCIDLDLRSTTLE